MDLTILLSIYRDRQHYRGLSVYSCAIFPIWLTYINSRYALSFASPNVVHLRCLFIEIEREKKTRQSKCLSLANIDLCSCAIQNLCLTDRPVFYLTCSGIVVNGTVVASQTSYSWNQFESILLGEFDYLNVFHNHDQYF